MMLARHSMSASSNGIELPVINNAQGELRLAVVDGSPLTQLPEDLYIPRRT